MMQYLENIVDFLKNHPLLLKNENDDGRLNSATNEEMILKQLLEKFKEIKTLVPNGNNLPFQCDWSKNREFSNRTEIEAMRYILDIYIKSWDKKVKGYPFALKEMLLNHRILETE